MIDPLPSNLWLSVVACRFLEMVRAAGEPPAPHCEAAIIGGQFRWSDVNAVHRCLILVTDPEAYARLSLAERPS